MRGPLLLAVVGFLFTSGCLQEVDRLDTVGEDDALERSALVGLQRDLPVRSWEPTIGVTSGGIIFMSTWSWDERLGPTLVMRSNDEGQTWEDVTPRLGPLTLFPNSNDPYIYLDDDTDRLFTFDLQGLVCQTLSWSDDFGETWMTNPAACGLPPGGHDHQTFFTSWSRGPIPTIGFEKVLHYCVNRVVDAACSASHDGGLTWGPLISVVPARFEGVSTDGNGTGITVCDSLHGHGIGAPDGRIYLPKGHCGEVRIMRSEDDGLTWTSHIVAEYDWVDHDVGIAADEAGGLHVLWLADGLPYYSRSSDRAETWSEPVLVGPEEVKKTTLPAIAAGADGRVVMTYYGTTSDVADLPSYEYGPDVVWNAYMTILFDDEDDSRSSTTILNDPADPLGRGACGGGRCRGIPGADPPSPSPGDFLDVVIDRDGRPWAALVDTCRDTCATEADPEWSPALGAVGTLAAGPALRGPSQPLPPLDG